MIDKESLKDYLDMDEEEYQEFNRKGLLPDKSEKAYQKFEALMKKGPPFDYYQLLFLGKMDLQRLMKEYPTEAYFYMDL